MNGGRVTHVWSSIYAVQTHDIYYGQKKYNWFGFSHFQYPPEILRSHAIANERTQNFAYEYQWCTFITTLRGVMVMPLA